MTLDDSVEPLIYTAAPELPQASDTCRCPYCGNPATHPLTTIPLLLGTTQLLFSLEVRRCPPPGCGLMWLRPHDAPLVATPLDRRHHRPAIATANVTVEPTHGC